MVVANNRRFEIKNYIHPSLNIVICESRNELIYIYNNVRNSVRLSRKYDVVSWLDGSRSAHN